VPPTSVSGGGPTLRLKVRVADRAGVPLSVRVTVTESVTGKPSAPAARFGAPVIAPVTELIVSPDGSPDADHLSAPVPPLAVTVAE